MFTQCKVKLWKASYWTIGENIIGAPQIKNDLKCTFKLWISYILQNKYIGSWLLSSFAPHIVIVIPNRATAIVVALYAHKG